MAAIHKRLARANGGPRPMRKDNDPLPKRRKTHPSFNGYSSCTGGRSRSSTFSAEMLQGRLLKSRHSATKRKERICFVLRGLFAFYRVALVVVILWKLVPAVIATTLDNPHEDLTYAELLRAEPNDLRVVRPGAVALHRRGVPEIHADDHLRLKVRAMNRTFHIHLRPDPYLIHPDATLEVNHGNGKPVEIKPLRARVYKGYVVDKQFSDTRAAWDAAGITGMFFSNHPTKGASESFKGIAGIFGAGGEDSLINDYVSKNGSQSFLDDGHPAARTPPLVGPGREPVFSRSWNLGEARVVLFQDGLAPTQKLMYHASFVADGEEYTVMPVHIYNALRREGDPQARNLVRRSPDREATMIAYRTSDTIAALQRRGIASTKTCGFRPGNIAEGPRMQSRLTQRSPQINRQHTPASQQRVAVVGQCLREPAFIYVGVVSDCNFSKRYQNSEQNVADVLFSVFSQVSAKYQDTFNIGVGIVRLVIKLSCGGDPWNSECSESFPIAKRLSDFSRWRGDQPTDEGLWHLMSTCPSGPTVGIAWRSTICERRTRTQNLGNGKEYVTGAGVSTVTRELWKVVAHEIGHNFGAIHDCTDAGCGLKMAAPGEAGDCCPCDTPGGIGKCDCGGRFLMHPSDKSTDTKFSACSVFDICSTLTRVAKSTHNCIVPPGRKLLRGSVCGNGIMEDGEECDCGDQCANDQCCTDKCTLKPNAKCSDRNHFGCCQSCQFKPAGTVCRPSNDFCDVPETCTGTSGTCTPDAFVENGTECQFNGTFPQGTADTYCAQGTCTNRHVQCYQASRDQKIALSRACGQPISDCSLTCQMTNSRTCVQLNGNFVDGTDCGLGGRCRAGECEGVSIHWLPSFIKANPLISAIVGVFLALFALSCTYACCRRRSCCDRCQRRPQPPKPTSRQPTLASPSAPSASAPTDVANRQQQASPAAIALYEEQQQFLSSLSRDTSAVTQAHSSIPPYHPLVPSSVQPSGSAYPPPALSAAYPSEAPGANGAPAPLPAFSPPPSPNYAISGARSNSGPQSGYPGSDWVQTHASASMPAPQEPYPSPPLGQGQGQGNAQSSGRAFHPRYDG